jgi:hypothetical protein
VYVGLPCLALHVNGIADMLHIDAGVAERYEDCDVFSVVGRLIVNYMPAAWSAVMSKAFTW